MSTTDFIEIRWHENESDPSLVCVLCHGILCSVEHRDTLEVLNGVAEAHLCSEHRKAAGE